MNNQEAIEILKAIYPSQKEIKTGEYDHVADALDDAISAIEKQIPKKPKVMETTLVGEKFWWYCGHCGASRHAGSKANYCGYCGGKVDWRGEDDTRFSNQEEPA